jgi:hypothetical protein
MERKVADQLEPAIRGVVESSEARCRASERKSGRASESRRRKTLRPAAPAAGGSLPHALCAESVAAICHFGRFAAAAA